MKKHESEVTLKWATPDLSTVVQKTNFHKGSRPLFTAGTSRFFASFGVCSDDWKKKKKKIEDENTKRRKGKTKENTRKI